MANNTFYSENDFRLYHHGIMGQKWGIRRYQNPDGTLTEAGRKRYATDVDRANYFTKRLNVNADKKAAVTYRYQKDLAKANDPYTVVRDEVHDRLNRKADERVIRNSKPIDDSTKALIAQAEEMGLKVHSYETDHYVRVGHDYMSGKDIATKVKGTGYYVSDRPTREQIQSSMQKARKDDTYNIDFLEAIQSKSMSKRDQLKEYEAYLEDPFDYWQTRSERLKKYKDEG